MKKSCEEVKSGQLFICCYDDSSSQIILITEVTECCIKFRVYYIYYEDNVEFPSSNLLRIGKPGECTPKLMDGWIHTTAGHTVKLSLKQYDMYVNDHVEFIS